MNDETPEYYYFVSSTSELAYKRFTIIVKELFNLYSKLNGFLLLLS